MDMVERVRAALLAEMSKGATNCVADYRAEGGDDEVFIDGHINGCALARAAIAAMRDPTRAMLEEGPLEPYMDEFVWARMIDAALTSSEPQAPASE